MLVALEDDEVKMVTMNLIRTMLKMKDPLFVFVSFLAELKTD